MRKVLVVFAFLVGHAAWAQKTIYQGFPSLVWPKLYDIKFVKGKDAQGEYDKPVFSDAVKALAGKKVSLPGYIVPFENGLKSSRLMLSSLPLNACFFCGVGGPETVVEVYLTEEISYTDKPMEVQGILRINDKDPDKMIYILEKAELIGEVE
jgi:hypothetical protein